MAVKNSVVVPATALASSPSGLQYLDLRLHSIMGDSQSSADNKLCSSACLLSLGILFLVSLSLTQNP